MSLTLLIWLVLFAGLAFLAFKRPAYGVAVYMLTVFACPPFWWWGDPIETYRWNFYCGWILLAAVVISRMIGSQRLGQNDPPESRRLRWLAVFMVLNATLVHVALADSWAISSEVYTYLLKFTLLFFLIAASVKDKTDYRIVLWSLLLGAAYIGYEVTVNDRGHIQGTRLEGVGMPNASTANALASLMVTLLPLCGSFFLVGKRWEKVMCLIAAPFIVNVLLLCNSRGAFLASIATAVVFLAAAPPGVRRKALKVVALGAVAVWLLLGDERIVERFATTFADAEERDSSAAGRLEYWKAGLEMITDYPAGAGGDGFHDVHGPKYIARISGQTFEARSVHNGYINTACDWGLQGLLLKMAFMGTATLLLWRTARYCNATGDEFGALMSCGLLAGMIGFLITSLFGDYLDNEWAFWMPACAVAHARLFYLPALNRSAIGQRPEHTLHMWSTTKRGAA